MDCKTRIERELKANKVAANGLEKFGLVVFFWAATAFVAMLIALLVSTLAGFAFGAGRDDMNAVGWTVFALIYLPVCWYQRKTYRELFNNKEG